MDQVQEVVAVSSVVDLKMTKPIDPARLPSIKKTLFDDFKGIFDTDGPFKPINGQPMKIELLPDAVPVAVN